MGMCVRVCVCMCVVNNTATESPFLNLKQNEQQISLHKSLPERQVSQKIEMSLKK